MHQGDGPTGRGGTGWVAASAIAAAMGCGAVVGCGAAAPAGPSHAGGHSHPAEGHGHGHGHEGSATADGPLVHRFERAEDWVERFEGPRRDAWQKPAHVVQLLQLEPGMKVADLGAGTGYFLPHLSAAVGPSGKVLGLDVEPDMVRYMRERAARESLANVEARQVPFDDPSLAPSSVDRVLVVDTWHHVPGRRAYCEKLAAALKPSGAVYVVDFTMDSELGPPRHHRLEPETVVQELSCAGLQVELVTEELSEQYVVRARKAHP